MLKIVFFIFLILNLGPCFGNGPTLSQYILDIEEPQRSQGEGKLVSKTKDALLSFDYIEKRADYLVFKLKNLTFGEYSENVMYIAPIITGNLEVNVHGVNIYYDHFSEKSGFKYKFKF